MRTCGSSKIWAPGSGMEGGEGGAAGLPAMTQAEAAAALTLVTPSAQPVQSGRMPQPVP